MQNASLNESSERIKSMTDLDILSIDAKIRKNFEEETSKLFEHKEKLQEIEETLKNLYNNQHGLIIALLM